MDLSRADLGLLLSLDTLIAERSVTRAAERLGISQPALSAQLARLRDLFGDPLLVQAGKKMTPTARATALQAPLHDLLDQLQALVREQQSFDPTTAERTFRIAATDYVHRVFTLAVVARLAELAAGVRIALLPFDARRAWNSLDDDEADLLLVSERLTPSQAIASRLFEERFVLALRKDHPLAGGPIDLDAFCALSHVLVSPQGGGFLGAADEQLAALGRRRHVALSVPSFLLAPSIVEGSDLVAVLPERLADLHAKTLKKFAPPIAIPGFPILASWHPRRQQDAGHRWLRGVFARNLLSAEPGAE